MGQILASAIMASARLSLRDPLPGLWWTDTDLLSFLNQGERNACALRPDLYTTHAPIPLVAGTLQTLPPGGTALIRLDENEVGLQRCRLVDAAMLDAAQRAWPAATRTKAVEEYCFNPKDPKRFSVNPPNDGTGSVVAQYAVVPPAIATPAGAINLDDIYELALKHVVLSEAYGFNTPKQDLNKAAFYRKSFDAMLGANAQGQAGAVPKYGATPGAA